METAEDNAVATECCVHASGLLVHVTSELLDEFFLEECRHLGRGEVHAVIPTEDRGAVICFNDKIVRDSILQRHQQYYAEGNHLFTTLSECPDDLAREVAKSFSATRGRQLGFPSSHMEAVKTDITTAENIHQVHTHTQPIYENATAGWFNPGAANPHLRHSYFPQYSQGYSQSAAGFGPPFIRGGSPWVPAPFATGPSIKGSYVPWGPPPDINYSFDSESSMIHDCMIVVHGFAPHTSEKAIKQYFESEFLAKGGPMKSFDYNAQTRVACFTYRDPKVAAKVLEKRSHQLDDTVLNVTANYVRSHQQHQQQTQINTENKLDETIVDTASQSTEIKVDLKTIKVQGFNCATRSETIQMFFESKKRSGGGEIESFQITNKNAALIAFKDPEDAQAVLDRGVLELEGANLNTSVYTPQKEELKTIEVRGFKQTTQDSTFEMFFESQKYSGGGPIESINIDRPNEVISITFCNTEVADRVLRKGTLELEGACLTITRARKEEENIEFLSTIEVHGMHRETSDIALEMFFENERRSGGGNIKNLKRDLSKNIALITYEDPAVASCVLSKGSFQLEDMKLRVQRPIRPKLNPDIDADNTFLCTVNVKGMKKGTAIGTVEMFFENEKRTGGGEIEKIKRDPSSGMINIVFKDPSVAKRVLDKKELRFEGELLSISRPLLVPVQAIEVRGIGDQTPDETLQMLFENQKRTGGGTVESIVHTQDFILIKFAEAEVAKRVVLQSQSKRILWEGRELDICLHTEEQTSEMKADEENMPEERHKEKKIPVNTIQVKGFKRCTSRDTLQMFFENRRRSGGGEVLDIQVNYKEGEALLTFKEPEAVDRVLQIADSSGVIVDGCRLTVKPSKPPPPVDKYKIFIKGLTDSTTKETLEIFLEAKTNCSIQSIVYGTEIGTALVAFDEIPDFEKLKAICNERTLDGSHLTVGKVTESNSIQVFDLPPNVTKDFLEAHFENKRRSSGGSVEAVKLYPDFHTAIVTFEDRNVVENVLKCQQILNESICRTAIFHKCLGVLPADHDPTKPFFPLPLPMEISDLNRRIVHFICNTPRHKKYVEEEFKKIYARVQWQNPDAMSDSLTITCTIARTMPNYRKLSEAWKGEVDRTVKRCFVEEFYFSELAILQAAWDRVVEGLKDLCQPSNDDFVLQTDESDHSVRVIGEAEVAKEVSRHVYSINSKVDEEIKRAAATITEKKEFKSHELRYLLAISYIDTAKREFPNLKLNIDLKGEKFVLTGVPDDINQAKISIYEITRSLKHDTFSMTKPALQLIQTKEGHAHLVKKFNEDSVLKAVWQIGVNDIAVYASSQDEIARASSIIKANILETPIHISAESRSIFGSAKWNETISELENQHQGLCKILLRDDLCTVTVVSTMELMGCLLEIIQDFLQANAIHNKYLRFENGKVRFLRMHQKQKLRAIESELSESQVKIKFSDTGEDPGFLVTGTEAGVTSATQKVNDLVKTIDSVVKEVNTPGMRQYIVSQRGREFLDHLENKGNCTVELPVPNPSSERDKATGGEVPVKSDTKPRLIPETKATGGCTVSVFREDITKHKVDAIVNAANAKLQHGGGLAKAISVKGGKEIQEECDKYIKKNGSLSGGKVFTSTAGKLTNCKKVIHAVGPIWQGGKKNEENILYEAVWSSMEEATLLGLQSIAFPALGSGVFGFPPDKCAVTILAAIQDFSKKRKDGSLTDIHLVDINSGTVDAFRKALNGEIRGTTDEEEDDILTGAVGYTYPDEDPTERDFRGLDDSVMVSDSEPLYSQTSTADTVNTKQGICVTLVRGAIANEQVDVIINTAGRDLDLDHGAVSKSLLAVGGQVLQDQCNQKAPNGNQYGEIIQTDSGKLKCKTVYHGSCDNWSSTGAEQNLLKLVRTCLETADKAGFSSISFPAIGTGNLGFPKDIVARDMFQEVADFGARNPATSIENIHFVVYDKDHATIAAFEAEMKKISSRSPQKKRGFHVKNSTGYDVEAEEILSDGPNCLMVGNLTIQVQQGDITQENIDAIVNSTNAELDIKKGAVSKAILAKAGNSLLDDCKRQSNPKDGIAVTGAGKLPCKHIIHLVAPNPYKTIFGFGTSWGKLILDCLKKAESMNITSICFPAVGTGENGRSPNEIAKVMYDTITNFEKQCKPQHLKLIRITIFQLTMVEDFLKELHRRIKENKKGYLKSMTDILIGYSTKAKPDHKKKKKKAKLREDMSLFLTIYSDTKESIDLAQKKIDELCKSQCKEKLYTDAEIIGKLSTSQVEQIKELDQYYPVKVTVEIQPRTKRIHVVGSSEDIYAVAEEIESIFKEVREAEHMFQKAEVLARSIQWHWLQTESDGKEDYVKYPSLTNAAIEKAYSDKRTCYEFRDNDGPCKIIFDKMQKVSAFKPACPVKRTDLAEREHFELPSNWKLVDYGPKNLCEIIDLQPSEREYQETEKEFRATIGTTKINQIVKIQRIQNPNLYQQLMVRKKHMDKVNQPGTANERMLWHGTCSDTLDSINRYGFNRSYCGKNATAYGNGVYFAVNSSYSASDTYSKPDSTGNKYMYQCLVLTGEYTKGKHGLIVPPQKDPKDKMILYDSVVDNGNTPSMFVVFSDTQAYPKHLIIFN